MIVRSNKISKLSAKSISSESMNKLMCDSSRGFSGPFSPFPITLSDKTEDVDIKLNRPAIPYFKLYYTSGAVEIWH